MVFFETKIKQLNVHLKSSSYGFLEFRKEETKKRIELALFLPLYSWRALITDSLFNKVHYLLKWVSLKLKAKIVQPDSLSTRKNRFCVDQCYFLLLNRNFVVHTLRRSLLFTGIYSNLEILHWKKFMFWQVHNFVDIKITSWCVAGYFFVSLYCFVWYANHGSVNKQ